jgi:hypothetical protein
VKREDERAAQERDSEREEELRHWRELEREAKRRARYGRPDPDRPRGWLGGTRGRDGYPNF